MYCLRWGLCMKMQICKAHTEIASNHRLSPYTTHPPTVRFLIYLYILFAFAIRSARALCHSFHLLNKWETLLWSAHAAQRACKRVCVFTSFIIASDFKELMLPSSRSLALSLDLTIALISISTFCLTLIALVICHLIADQQMFEHL